MFFLYSNLAAGRVKEGQAAHFAASIAALFISKWLRMSIGFSIECDHL